MNEDLIQDEDDCLDKETFDRIRNDVSMQRSASSSQENNHEEQQNSTRV